MESKEIQLELEPIDNSRLANLCGQFDENLRYIEKNTGVSIGNRGNQFRLSGLDAKALDATERVLRRLYLITKSSSVSVEDIHLELKGSEVAERNVDQEGEAVYTRRVKVVARGMSQRAYIKSIRSNDICFGIGPAGTGKTYLAVASAVAALESDSVRRVCLVRPAVEAGE